MVEICEPECPYCYSGKIVMDTNVPSILFCNRCFKEVKLKKFERWKTMNCPACGIGEKYQIPTKTENKVQCRGCGTIFFDKTKL